MKTTELTDEEITTASTLQLLHSLLDAYWACGGDFETQFTVFQNVHPAASRSDRNLLDNMPGTIGLLIQQLVEAAGRAMGRDIEREYLAQSADAHQPQTELQQADEHRRRIVMNNPFMRWCVESQGLDIDNAYYMAIDPYPAAAAMRDRYQQETGRAAK